MATPTPTATKVTFAFASGGYGWSMSLYLNAWDATLAIPKVKAAAIAAKLEHLTGAFTNVEFYRIQGYPGVRLGQTLSYNSGASSSTASQLPESVAAYVRAYSPGFQQSKLIFLRGLATANVGGDGKIAPGSLLPTKIADLQTQLVADGWGWFGKNLATSTGPVPVVTVVLGANNLPTITFAANVFPAPVAPAGYPYLTKVNLSKLKGCDTLNGGWVVNALSATSCQFVKQVLANAWIPPIGFGYCPQLAFIPINTLAFQRFGERKPGRPLYRSRGRSTRKRVVY